MYLCVHVLYTGHEFLNFVENRFMKTLLTASLLLCCASFATAQKSKGDPERDIRRVLERQVAAWNAGNIDEFMEGYWKSDSVQFIGSEIVTGWTATLQRYKKNYPDKDAMGVLRFELLQLQPVREDAYLITGKYFLTRKQDNPHGIFTLLFRRKGGKWVITYDHTSG
jgi:hypothetical protein